MLQYALHTHTSSPFENLIFKVDSEFHYCVVCYRFGFNAMKEMEVVSIIFCGVQKFRLISLFN